MDEVHQDVNEPREIPYWATFRWDRAAIWLLLAAAVVKLILELLQR